MAKKFLNLTGLTTLKSQLLNFFASATEVAEVEEDTATYVTEIDYEKYLAFDTSIIIGDGASPVLDVGQLDMMILG